MVAPSVMPGRAFQRVDRVSRLLFHWTARDLSLIPRTGQVPTFTRASPGSAIDRRSRLRMLAHSQPRFEMYDIVGDGIRKEPGLVIEGARAQKLTAPEDISNGAWTKTGVTVPSTNNPSPRNGDLTASFVREDTSTGEHGIFQGFTVSAAGNAVGLLGMVKANGRTKGHIEIYDATSPFPSAGADFDLTAGTIVAAPIGAGADIFLTITPLADGYYILEVYGTAGALSTTKRWHLYFKDAGGAQSYTGDGASGMFVWGCVATDNTMAGHYWGIGASAAADSLTYALGAGLKPRDLTVLARMARPVWADAAGVLDSHKGVFSISTSESMLRFWGDLSNRNWSPNIETAGTDTSVSTAILAGNPQTIAIQFRLLTTGGKVKQDVGAGFGAESGAASGFSAFGTQTLRVGATDGITRPLDGGLLELKVAAGLYSLAQMQEMT